MNQPNVHPSVKLLLFAMLAALPFIFQHPLVLALVFILNLMVATKLGWTASICKAYLVIGGVGGMFTAVTWLPFMDIGHSYWQSALPILGYPLQVTDVGILWAMGMGLRIANLVLVSMFYFFTTSPREIAMALKGVGIPYSIGFLLSLIFRFIPMVKHDLQTIREAQMARGLQLHKGSLLRKVKNYSYLMVPLIFTSLKRVQLMANALDSKGFQIRGGRHRYYRMPKWSKSEVCGVVCGFIVVAILFYMARIHEAQLGIIIPERI